MSRFLRRFAHLLVATGCVAVLLAPSAPTARADEFPPPAISLTQLGLSNRIDLVGANESSNISVPVPQGVSPTILTGTIGAVAKVAGRVDVVDGRGVVLGSIPIPLDVAAAPFVVDVSAAEVLAGTATLSFVIRDVDEASSGPCRQPPSVTLSQLATTFSGPTPSPRTVADFMPGYLDQITIWVGPKPNREQQQAALVLVAELTRRYRPMPVRIDVDTAEAPPTGDGPGTRRTIAIIASDQAGLSVENPDTAAAVLTIAGKGDELLRQVDLFTDRRDGLAQTTSAAVTSVDRSKPTATDTLAFADLGIKAETSVLGVSNLFIGFDAAKFAVGPINGAQVHLIAKYTPVTNAEASLLIRSGGAILASAVLDPSGTVDLTADLPSDQMTSNVALALEVRYVPRRDCPGALDRMSFAVDSTSTITVRPGMSGRGGFALFPTAFGPEFDVALADADQLGPAAQAINLMGQQSSVALRPNVTTLAAAVTRSSGLLVAATGGDLARIGMRPPLMMTNSTDVDVNGNPVTGINLNGPLGVVEAFPRDGRMVLAIDTSGTPALIDRSFDYIRGLPGQWASLTGDVVATGAAETTLELAVGMKASTVDSATAPSDGWHWWVWLAIASAAVVLLALAAVLVIRSRRAPQR